MKRDPQALTDLSERLKCVSRILAAQNARGGRPLGAHDLADLTQNTVVVILKKLPSFEGRGPLEGWVYRICCLEFMNEVRRHRKLPKPDGEIDARVEEAGGSQSDADPFEFEELNQALASLEEDEARLIERKHFDALTFEEIAQRLGVPTNTVKTRYYRAIGRLRVLMGAEGFQGGSQ